MKVCIHQPVYYPWLGTIHKALYADRFLVFDDSPAVRPSWMNRVQIAMQGKRGWLSVPILFRKSDNIPMRETRINGEVNWSEKHIKTVRQYYSKAPHFDEVMELMEPVHNSRHTFLVDLNLDVMNTIFRLLGRDVDMVLSSELDCGTHGKVSRLARMVRSAGGTVYVNGMGAESYFEEAPFLERGQTVHHQILPHQTYSPFNADEFMPGLSILDVVANIGFQGVGTLLADNDVANNARFVAETDNSMGADMSDHTAINEATPNKEVNHA